MFTCCLVKSPGRGFTNIDAPRPPIPIPPISGILVPHSKQILLLKRFMDYALDPLTVLPALKAPPPPPVEVLYAAQPQLYPEGTDPSILLPGKPFLYSQFPLDSWVL